MGTAAAVAASVACAVAVAVAVAAEIPTIGGLGNCEITTRVCMRLHRN